MTDRVGTRAIEKLTDVLEELGIAYAIGGSVASSLYGKVRLTQDADITVEPFGGVLERLYGMLKDDYYVSKQAMARAVDSCGSFNIVHFESAFKIDLFVQGQSEFEQQLLRRSRRVRIDDSIEKSFCVVSPEDVILLKLRWYSEGGCVSERQWDDVQGVLGTQGQLLDFRHLEAWSRKLGLHELLERAISESRAQ